MLKLQYDIPRVIITQNMMLNTARSCVSTMEILNNGHGEQLSSWLIPYYILATTALELFPKIILFKRREDGEHISGQDKYLRKFAHNLHKLYQPSVVGSNFLKKTGIESVIELKDQEQFVYRYNFNIGGQKDPIQVYHIESLRYGLMPDGRSNAGFVANQFNQLLSLCQNVQSALTMGPSVLTATKY